MLIIAGTLQPKPINNETKARPGRFIVAMILSVIKAALAIYPDCSNKLKAENNKNSGGMNDNVVVMAVPRPLKSSSVSQFGSAIFEFNKEIGSFTSQSSQLAANGSWIEEPKFKHAANIVYIIRRKIGKPKTGCKSSLSILFVLALDFEVMLLVWLTFNIFCKRLYLMSATMISGSSSKAAAIIFC